MKSIINASKVHDGLLKINRQRVIYYQKASEKMRELNLKTLLNAMVEGRKNEPVQILEITKTDSDEVISPIKRSKLYRFSMKVKTAIYHAYELE